MAGMVSLGFVETNPQTIVKKAARLIHPDSPYRQCLNQVIAMAEVGRRPEQIAAEIEDRWRIEYPASNSAVANGALVALAVWFGQGNFLRTSIWFIDPLTSRTRTAMRPMPQQSLLPLAE